MMCALDGIVSSYCCLPTTTDLLVLNQLKQGNITNEETDETITTTIAMVHRKRAMAHNGKNCENWH